MRVEQIDTIVELRLRIKAYTAEFQRLNDILDEYLAGAHSFEGIRLYSRVHSSIDLSNEFVSTVEVLNLYLDRLQAKIRDLNAELESIINPPTEEPTKTKRRSWFKL